MQPEKETEQIPTKACCCCNATGSDLRRLQNEQWGAACALSSNNVLDLESTTRAQSWWCSPCRKVISRIPNQGTVSTNKKPHVARKRPPRQLSGEEALAELQRIKTRRLSTQKSNSFICTLCGTSIAGRPYTHQSVSNLCMQRVPNILSQVTHFASDFVRVRKECCDNVSPSDVEDILLRATSISYICAAHYQALKRHSILFALESCATCTTKNPKSQTVSLEGKFDPNDTVSWMVALETVGILRHLHSTPEDRREKDILCNDGQSNRKTVWLSNFINRLQYEEKKTEQEKPDEGGFEDVAEYPQNFVDILKIGRVCLTCYKAIKTKVEKGVKTPLPAFGASVPTRVGSYPDEAMRNVVIEEERRLLSDNGAVGSTVKLYERYVQQFKEMYGSALKPKPIRTMARTISRNTQLAMFDFRSNETGNILISQSSVRSFVISGIHKAKREHVADLADMKGTLNDIGNFYKENKERFKHGDWNTVEEIKRFSPVLWAHIWILVESKREKVQRLIAFQAADWDLMRVGWPFSNGPAASESGFNNLPPHTHTKVMAVFSLLQQLVVLRDREAAGPITWAISTCALTSGDKPFMGLLNRLGYSVSYTMMNRVRNRIAQSQRDTPLILKVDPKLLLKVAWDNIDARMVSNVIRIFGKSLDWHGTILLSLQMPDTNPILSKNPFRKINLRHYPTAEIFLEAACTNTEAVSSFNTLIAALVAVFKRNLISSEADKQVSLDFLIRLSLRGSSIGKPAKISNMLIMDKPSNSADTAAYLMSQVQALTTKISAEENDPQGTTRYSAMTCDFPLYKQEQTLMRDTPDGSRNPAYSNILPLLGQMHQSMAFQDVVKFCAWDSSLDVLAGASGLSKSVIENFRTRKEYKTTLRLFRQCLVSMWIRLFDVIFEDGLLTQDEEQFQALNVTPGQTHCDAKPLSEVLRSVVDIAEKDGPVSKTFDETLQCDERFFGSAMQKIGENVISVIQEKAKDIAEVNFSFFAMDVMLSLLAPSLMMYYASRAGQLHARQAAIRHFIPYLFTTKKTSYQQAAVWQLEFDSTAPQDVLDILYGPGGSCTNINGESPYGNVEDDEALEMTGVRDTKAGASAGTYASLTKSFYSSHVLRRTRQKILSETRTVKQNEEYLETDDEPFPLDLYKSEAINVCAMYDIANGTTSPSGLAFLGPEHRQNPNLVNILSKDSLTLPMAETQKLIQRRKIGLANAADLFRRMVRPFKNIGDTQTATRKNAVLGFAGARDTKRRNTEREIKKRGEIGRIQLVKSSTQAIARRFLQCSEVLELEKSTQDERDVAVKMSKRIRERIDLLSPLNLTMRVPGSDTPRRGVKSDFFKELCRVICPRVIENNGPVLKSFTADGYPPIPMGVPQQQLFAAVDISNVLHHPVHEVYALTIGMHAQQLARVSTNALLRLANLTGLTLLELHIDEFGLVVKQKGEIWHLRDTMRVSHGLDHSKSNLSLNEPIPKDWNSSVLGVRERKALWANGLMGTIAVHCGKKLAEFRNETTVVQFYGAPLRMSKKVLLGEVDATMMEATMLGCGTCLVHGASEVVSDETVPANSLHTNWSMKTKLCTDGNTWTVSVWSDSAKNCRHGEAETRMQYTLAKALERLSDDQAAKTTVVQISKDTDNVCLAMLAESEGTLRRALNVFVRVGHRYYDIKKLLFALQSWKHAPLTAKSIAILYASSGNDFNASCAVASNKALVRTYCQLGSLIGDLSTSESCKSLFYYTFASVLAGGSASNLPLELQSFAPMSSEWCSAVRSYVLFHPRTRTAGSLIPQDDDLHLVFLRSKVFNIDSYWIPALNSRNLINLPCGDHVGTDKDGKMLLERQESVTEREIEIMFRMGTCGCGKSGQDTNTSCCVVPPVSAGRNPKCGCAKAGRMCWSNCRCDAVRCANRLGGENAARIRMDAAATASPTAPSSTVQGFPLSRILNSDNSTAEVNTAESLQIESTESEEEGLWSEDEEENRISESDEED